MGVEETVAQTMQLINAENQREGRPLYSFRPIPCELDMLISELVKLFMKAEENERRCISTAVPPADGCFLTCFAERMATLGVRERSRQRLLEGLVALVMEGYKEDFRDNMINLAPLYDAAVKLGVEPQELFNEAAAHLNNAPARDLIEFPQRKPEDRSLEAMYFKESHDADGFKYERLF